jgi:hypothetical protein
VKDPRPVEPEARRGPACTCCRKGRVRVGVRTSGGYLAVACPACDCVEAAENRGAGDPLASAPKVPRATP